MENLVPRQIKPVEAARLGIKDGWYGTKVNGTLMTEPFADLEECEKQIRKLTGVATKRSGD
jgi:hypothetical protein